MTDFPFLFVKHVFASWKPSSHLGRSGAKLKAGATASSFFHAISPMFFYEYNHEPDPVPHET